PYPAGIRRVDPVHPRRPVPDPLAVRLDEQHPVPRDVAARYEGGQRHPLRRGPPYVDAQHEPRRVEPRVPAHPVVDLLARTHQQSSPPSAPATSSTAPP